MKKLIFISILLSQFLFAGIFAKEELNLIWMTNHKNRPYQILINSTIKALQKDYNVNFKTLSNYSAINSVIENENFSADNKKLSAGLLADNTVFNKDGYYVLFKIEKRNKEVYIKGVKLKKDGNEAFAFPMSIKEKLTNNNKKNAQIIANMLYFFVKSSLIPYKPVKREGVRPVIVENNKEIKVISFKKKDVRLFTETIPQEDIDLAKNLHLINAKNDADFAKKYCSMLDMLLPNVNYVDPDEEYYFEEYFIEADYIDGFKVFKKYLPSSSDKKFRCMGNNHTLYMEPLEDFELNKLGIYYKLNNHKFNIAGDIIDLENIYLVDSNGHLTKWKKGKEIKSNDINYIRQIYGLNAESYKVKIESYNSETECNTYLGGCTQKDVNNHYQDGVYYIKKGVDYAIEADNYLYYKGKKIFSEFKVSTFTNILYQPQVYLGGTNGEIAIRYSNKKIKHFKHLNGSIVKIVPIDNLRFAAVSDKGDFAVYKISQKDPIFIFPQIGYAYNDIAISRNGKYILLINANYTSYVLLADKLLSKEQK